MTGLKSWLDKGKAIVNPKSKIGMTTQEQLDLLESHPLFTGCCPQCRWEFDRSNLPAVHWDCPDCGWKDDSV